MLVFDGSYMLERDEDPGASPAHACSWRVKIIDFSTSSDSVCAHIRPFALLAVRNKGGIFKTSCAESLGKRICKDFNLRVGNMLWIEVFGDFPGDFFAAVFTPRYGDNVETHTIAWRPLLKNEYEAIVPWLD